MADSGENDNSIPDNGEPSEPLVKWERICALTIGAICGGAGGYAVFEKSNQAGTAMLLILAAIFLLIGVQGTPLIRFGSSSGSVELERRRRREVREALEQANEENNAEKAEGIVEGVRLVAPDLVPKSFTSYRQYEDSVAQALSAMGYEVTQWDTPSRRGPDLKITKNGRTVYAEVKLYQKMVTSDVIYQALGMASTLSAPVLIIASNRLTRPASHQIIDLNNVDFARWRDEVDNPDLRETLERLLAKVNPDDRDVSEP
jgi:Restriction endonuclease